MCCAIAVLGVLGPRALIIFWWLVDPARWNVVFSGGALLPALGFVFLPWTTIMYVLFWTVGGLDFVGWVFVVLAFVLDIGTYGGGASGTGSGLRTTAQVRTAPTAMTSAPPPGSRRRPSLLSRRLCSIGLVAACNAGGGPGFTGRTGSASLVSGALNAIATAPGVRYALIDRGRQAKAASSRRATSTSSRAGSPARPMVERPAVRCSCSVGRRTARSSSPTACSSRPRVGRGSASPMDTQFFHPLMDRTGLSKALAAAFGASAIDPVVRSAPCGAESCRVVGLVVPRPALAGLIDVRLRGSCPELPPDLAPVALDLHLDPSGFPVRMETRISAGPTVTAVSLQAGASRPAAGIVPPIP